MPERSFSPDDGSSCVDPTLSERWALALSRLGLAAADLLAVSAYDPYRRAYRTAGQVHKVVLKDLDLTSALRMQDLHGEHRILEQVETVRGVPRSLGVTETDKEIVLHIEALPGRPVSTLNMGLVRGFLVWLRIFAIVIRLARRGVGHNDLVTANVLVHGFSKVSLIDFDQATTGTPVAVLWEQIRPAARRDRAMKQGLPDLSRNLIKAALPERLLSSMGRIRDLINTRRNRIRPLPKTADDRLRSLHTAWQIAAAASASSPDKNVAYYSLDVGGYTLPGERPWMSRWEYLSRAGPFEEKRILEVGCNMGLLSTWLLSEGRASDVLAIDVDSDILHAASLIASAFGVQPDFKRVDLDHDVEWEDDLTAFRPDIVFALNVLHWLEDPLRFLAFLSGVSEVVYEGHDPIETEIARLRSVGFDRIRLLAISERGRAVLHCNKTH